MKSIAELQALRDKAREKMTVREGAHDGTRVVVGMATCGIAAGARPVLKAFTEEIAKRKLGHVAVVQTGCIGMCQLEPIVEIIAPDKEKVTYGKVTPEIVEKIVVDHLVNGNPVAEYTVANLMK